MIQLDKLYKTHSVINNGLTGNKQTLYYFLLEQNFHSGGILIEETFMKDSPVYRISTVSVLTGPNVFIASSILEANRKRIIDLYNQFISYDNSKLKTILDTHF